MILVKSAETVIAHFGSKEANISQPILIQFNTALGSIKILIKTTIKRTIKTNEDVLFASQIK